MRRRGEKIIVGVQISHMVALQRYGWEIEEGVCESVRIYMWGGGIKLDNEVEK